MIDSNNLKNCKTSKPNLPFESKSTTHLSHVIKLDPTFKQITYFNKGCGTARFVWNWGLANWDKQYQAGLKPSGLGLKKEFNAIKATEFPWTYEVTKYASQQPFIYLQSAFQGFFEKRAEYPKFKKKGEKDSFYIGGDQLKVQEQQVKIPNLGWVRLKEPLRFEGKIRSATISCKAGHWFISINVETSQKPAACKNQATVGVDLGITSLATLSNGTSICGPRPLKKYLKQLKRLQRKVSGRVKGSKNRKKAQKALAKLHYKIGCTRNDSLHKLTTHLTSNFKNIIIEDLDVSDMLRNKKLSRHIMDMGWFEFRRQLSYKAELRGNKVYIANRWYASSKQCSSCGKQKDIHLSERTYSCTHCGLEINRDLNASKCLEQLINTGSSPEINACGQNGSVTRLKTGLQPVWKKQELSHV